jgi:pyruvate formate lyase activating enzyme
MCGVCTQVCPAKALEVVGSTLTPEETYQEVAKDTVFYDTSGGGVTFSGGEPMVQPEFIQAAATICRQAGIHVALDTCGAATWEQYERVLKVIDLVLYDLKVLDPEQHRKSTGMDNATILKNARQISKLGIPMWVRTPVIPGFTADHQNIAALGDFISTELPSVERWELLAYTNLGQPKYHRLEQPYALEGVPLVTQAEMEAIHSIAIQRAETAVWSGATRSEETTGS